MQQVTQKIRIDHAKLRLHLDSEVSSSSAATSHDCNNCKYTLDQESSEAVHNFPVLETYVHADVKQSLVYIAGYITRKDNKSSGEQDTLLYFDQYGCYTRALNRGRLSIPGDSVCQWTIFCYIIFNLIKDHVCRVSLIDIFQKISDFYMFNIEKHHSHILANILISKYCLTCCPKTHKETGQKVLKLS